MRNNNELDKLRRQIDEIDKNIFSLISKRMAIVKKIGEFKKQHSLAVVDKDREEKIINKNAQDSGLDKNFARRLYQVIFKHSYLQQQKNK